MHQYIGRSTGNSQCPALRFIAIIWFLSAQCNPSCVVSSFSYLFFGGFVSVLGYVMSNGMTGDNELENV
jgi:hypothetical protein